LQYPDGVRYNAPRTFAARVDAEAWITNKRKEIDRRLWDAADDKREQITFGAYAAGWLAGRQVAGHPIKARTREHYQNILDDHLLDAFGNCQLAAIKPKDVRDWHAATLVDKPTMRSHAYSMLRTIFTSAVNDELIDGNPCRIVGAGRAKRVHKIRPASIEELAVLTAEMPERLQLMVTLASWLAHLDAKGVAHSGIIDIGFGPTVVFRDPDNIQLEFFVSPSPDEVAGLISEAESPGVRALQEQASGIN
jgi:hypothetical protein